MLSFGIRMGFYPHFIDEPEKEWLAQGHSESTWWMVTQILACPTSQHSSSMSHQSPHLWTVPPTLLPKYNRQGQVCSGTSWENNGSYNQQGSTMLVFLTWYCICPVRAIQRLLTD